uniref:RNA-directed DNA polymerase n=1 Tax=Strongyloides papillosus TaxID=174720 RepID=A0A0N5BQU7_STREA
MGDITLRRSDRLAVESLLVTLRTLKESESWSEEELERLAIQKFRVLQRYNPGSRRLIEECRKILKSVSRRSENSEKKVDSKKRKKRSDFTGRMSVSGNENIVPVATTVPTTPTITVAGSRPLPFENTPTVTGVGGHHIPFVGTPVVTGIGGYQTPFGMQASVPNYIPYYINYPPNHQATSSLRILSNITKYSKTNPRPFKHYIEDLQVMFRIEKIPEEDWGDILWLSLDDQIREELGHIPESVKTSYISLKATLMEKFATHPEAKQSRMEADVFELNVADGEKLMKSLKSYVELMKKGFSDMDQKQLVEAAEKILYKIKVFGDLQELIFEAYAACKEYIVDARRNRRSADNEEKKAKNVIRCYYCGGDNHKKSQCKKLKNESENNKNLSNINSKSVKNTSGRIDKGRKNGVSVLAEVSGKEAEIYLDTGSDINIISVDDVEPLKVKNIKLKTERFEVGGGDESNVNTLITTGCGDLDVKFGACNFKVKCHFVTDNRLFAPSLMMLGNEFLDRLNSYKVDNQNKVFILNDLCEVPLILHKIENSFPCEGKKKVRRVNVIRDEQMVHEEEKLKETYKEAFSLNNFDIGRCVVPATKIQLVKDVELPKPVKYNYNPIKARQIAELKIPSMEAGIIVPDDDMSCKFVSNHVLVAKPRGLWRLCLDVRILNKYILPMPIDLPNIEQVIYKMSKQKYFFCIDLTQSFLQIELLKEDQDLFGVYTHKGIYKYTRVVFGSRCSSQLFVKALNTVLKDFIESNNDDWGVICYVDDIVGFAKSFSQLKTLAKDVILTLKDNGFKINREKSKFFARKCTFLSYEITKDGFTISDAYLDKLKQYEMPQNVKQLKRFLGMAQYFKRNLNNLGLIIKPLLNLLKKDTCWKFDQKCIDAYNKVIDLMTSKPLICSPMYDGREFYLMVDSSLDGFGSMLYQLDGKKKCVIAYHAERFKEFKVRPSAIELELLGIYKALVHYSSMLYGCKVVIQNDHKPMNAYTKTTLSPKSLYYIEKMEEFDYQIVYKDNNSVKVVDSLSRQFITGIITIDQHLDGNKPDDKTIRDIFYKIHDKMGHFSYSRTYPLVCEYLSYPGLSKDYSEYLRSCDVCKKVNPAVPVKIQKGLAVATRPLQIVSTDVLGPLISSENNFKFVLNIVDSLSRFIVLVPLHSTSGQEVWTKFRDEFIYSYGIPVIIISDGASYYLGENFTNGCAEFGIIHRVSRAGYHNDNTLSERSFKTLNDCLRKQLVDINHIRWPEFIKPIQFFMNNTVHKSLTTTPSQLFMGIKNRIMDMKNDKLYDVTMTPYIAEKSYEIAKLVLAEKNNFDYEKYDDKDRFFGLKCGGEPEKVSDCGNYKKKSSKILKNNPSKLSVGSEVLILESVKNKLNPKWKDGYVITKRSGTTVYVKQINGGRGRPLKRHITQVKPNWVRSSLEEDLI